MRNSKIYLMSEEVFSTSFLSTTGLYSYHWNILKSLLFEIIFCQDCLSNVIGFHCIFRLDITWIDRYAIDSSVFISWILKDNIVASMMLGRPSFVSFYQIFHTLC